MERTSDDRLRGVLAVGGIAAALTVAVLIFFLIDAYRQRDKALSAQSASYQTLILAREVLLRMSAAEASLGRYVISGEAGAGVQFEDDWRRAGTILRRLDSTVPDDTRLSPTVKALVSAYQRRGTELGDVALRTTYRQNSDALSLYYQAGKSPLVREIEKLGEEIVTQQRRALDSTAQAAAEQVDWSSRVGALVAGAGLVLLLMLIALALRTMTALQARQDEEERSEALENAVALRTRELSEANARLLAAMDEREAAEERLRQGQKLEAVGQLTGGIAHDFNNMLSVVVSALELALRRLSPAHEAPRAFVEQALDGAQRAAALTKRLLAFARAEPLLPEPHAPTELIRGMQTLLDRTLGDGVQVEIRSETTAPVYIDPHQLENAVLNLVVNARDAMDGQGTIAITIMDHVIEQGEVTATELPPGDYVCIAVTDSGRGMSEAVKARLFEPFFTTKPTGQGTGLGLSQIFGFVRQSHGRVLVDSEEGVGTTITLVLPRYDGPMPARQAAGRADDDAPALPHTILVIEDDPRVLAQTCAGLTELGHRPLPSPAGQDAEALLAAHPDISLILSDVQMPGISGPALVARLRSIRPDLPALFVTGFAGDIDSAAEFAGAGVLRKPFTLRALDRAVRGAVPPPA